MRLFPLNGFSVLVVVPKRSNVFAGSWAYGRFFIAVVMENPYGMHSYIGKCFVTNPAIIDKDRTLRGDIFRKPTAYWFINCEPTKGFTLQKLHTAKIVKKDAKPGISAGTCSEERSMISPDYARNFICDFILGKSQPDICPTLFD